MVVCQADAVKVTFFEVNLARVASPELKKGRNIPGVRVPLLVNGAKLSANTCICLGLEVYEISPE